MFLPVKKLPGIILGIVSETLTDIGRKGFDLGYNANFSKAALLRQTTVKMLAEYMKQITGKPEEEKQRLLDQFAKEIEETCPYREGIDPSLLK